MKQFIPILFMHFVLILDSKIQTTNFSELDTNARRTQR